MDFIKILAEQKEELHSINLDKLVKRAEEKDIDLDSKFAQVVIGVRRCGKSTLCQKVLIEHNVKFGYINFDDDRLIGLKAEHFDELLSALYRLNGDFSHLFLDEIQNIEHWELFVNRLLRQSIKLLITGSNANLLSGELATHLTGRYNSIELLPFSFSEYCEAKSISNNQFTTKSKALLKKAFDEYLLRGGFPEIVEGSAPKNYAMNLLSTIVNKDVARRYRVKYTDVLWKLTNVLLENTGRIISPANLAEELGVKSYHTIEKYIEYLVNAYLIVPAKKFSTKSIERKNSSKSYAIDMAFISQHGDKFQSEDLGWRIENIVALELIRRKPRTNVGEVYFLKKGREFDVDFVLTDSSRITELIQVTYDFKDPSIKLFNREIGNLIKASKSTGCKNLTLIIGEGEPKEIIKEGLTVKVKMIENWLLNPFHN
ncbi:MAG: ATP-binding protein [Muribaculaceae bacterium]|nr:ATP-binding protein [Muribaculaceae bacterium]